ncbi:hypothetical protein [Fibrivirga algicola]|uniref:Uncharacterized protein n=1 Tax=Fibrivirga algicola TaxID=2950420 RepID=A0ABX0QBT5_9BACT|nr:hypothetical protein [Fibrivirga algicola]NID09541.1 hypothetical protein [Fibrivirga algicola]
MVLIALLGSCRTQEPQPAPTYTNQVGMVHAKTTTRGGPSQYILEDGDESSATLRRYLVTNFPDSLRQYMLGRTYGAPVIFSGVTSLVLKPVIEPSAYDGTETDYELPTIELTAIRRKQL